MSDWAPRRFWEEVSVRPENGGFRVYLDARSLRTPHRSELLAPSAGLAEEVAAEWRAQGERIDPLSMPFTRSLNSAIDKVAPNPGPVADMLAAYAETDLLCYRAEHPDELIARQAETWDPYLDWAAERYGARLQPVKGLMPVDQPAEAVAAVARAVHGLDPYALTAAHDLITLTGSVILGLSGIEGHAEADTLWHAARLDELWQIERWGEDEEAERQAAARADAIRHALNFHRVARETD
ncbi:MAG: ATP12 family protein [Pseudomonadota bacterium]